jgi:hypothetical protein
MLQHARRRPERKALKEPREYWVRAEPGDASIAADRESSRRERKSFRRQPGRSDRGSRFHETSPRSLTRPVPVVISC